MTLKNKLKNAVLFGIAPNNQWALLARNGTIDLPDDDMVCLIPGNASCGLKSGKPILQLISTAKDVYGISITLSSNGNPLTYGTTITGQELQKAFETPGVMAQLLHDRFGLQDTLIEAAIGKKKPVARTKSFWSRIAVWLMTISLLHNRPCLLGTMSNTIANPVLIIQYLWRYFPRSYKSQALVISPFETCDKQIGVLFSRQAECTHISFEKSRNYFLFDLIDSEASIRPNNWLTALLGLS